MSSVVELPNLDDLNSEQWEKLAKQAAIMQQQAALKEKRASKLDQAMCEASSRAPSAKAIDVCFVMDCTPSMRQVIKAAKKKVGEIQRRICSMLGHGGNVRFAIVAYRDHQYRRPIEILPFSNDLTEVSSFLSALEASDEAKAGAKSGDICEDVIGGLNAATKLQWQVKTRILYLLCDAPPHGKRFANHAAMEKVQRWLPLNFDLSPDDAAQWGLTDSMMATTIDLQLNLLVLKYSTVAHSLCDKMFDVFAELRKDHPHPSKPLQTLAFQPQSSADDLVSCILKGTRETLSLSRGSAARSSGRDPDGGSLTFSVKVAIFWTDRNCLLWKSWPLHDAFVTHLRVVGLTSDPQRNTVVRKLHIRPEPFAEGAMRYAFPATTEDGKRFVLKVHKVGVQAEKECLVDVQTQAYAKFFGEAFAQRFPDAPIQFLESWQVELLGCPIGRHATLEPFLEGKYQKYTNNSGFIAEGAKLAEAFSHFTFCHSGGQMMVTDLQGFESSILTDPQIHCVNKDLFGRGNLGKDGMDQCFLGHTCNEICAALKLKPHPMQLALDEEKTSVEAGSSASSTPSSTHGSQICELCGALFKLRQQEYLDTINKYQAVLCAECGAKVDANNLSVPCGSCSKEVYFSPYAIAIKGCAKPEKCRDCELSEEWMFVDD